MTDAALAYQDYGYEAIAIDFDPSNSNSPNAQTGLNFVPGSASLFLLPSALGSQVAGSISGNVNNFSSFNVKSNGAEMTTPTREEIDARFATAEAKTETRFVELSGKIDRVIDAVGRSAADYLRITGELKSEMQAVNQTIKEDNKLTRYTIIGAIVAGILAGLGALWVTQGNLLASFQAGLSIHENHPPAAPPTVPSTKP